MAAGKESSAVPNAGTALKPLIWQEKAQAGRAGRRRRRGPGLKIEQGGRRLVEN
jgi:hypothetical protein